MSSRRGTHRTDLEELVDNFAEKLYTKNSWKMLGVDYSLLIRVYFPFHRIHVWNEQNLCQK